MKTNALKIFLLNNFSLKDFTSNKEILKACLSLDDSDIWGSIKIWQYHEDAVLSKLSRMLIERDLFKIKFYNKPISKDYRDRIIERIKDRFGLNKEDASYFIKDGKLSNAAYELTNSKINVLMKNGNIVDIASAADLPNIKAMSKIVKKYYLCFPKSVSL